MATLPRFHASTLHYRLCSAALIGVAALALAACGSGGGESTDPARKSLLDQREKQLTQREAAVSQKAKDQKAKDRELANKEEELNNRPPRTVPGPERVVTRTVQAPPTGPTHVGFSGGNFSSDEINGLGGRVFDIQDFPFVYFMEEPPRFIHSRILANHRGYTFSKLIPAISENNVSYTLKTYWIDVTLEYSRDQIITDEESSRRTTSDRYKIFDLASPTDITGLGLSDTFTYKLFKGEVDPRRTDTTSATDDSKFHAEVVTDYASDNTNDYLHFGWWVMVPKQAASLKDYDLGVFADATYDYSPSDFDALTGTATYTGSMMGLHTEVEKSNGKTTLSRLTGKATLTADFGDNSTTGSLAGTFDELKLNGTDATGSITFQNLDLLDSQMQVYLGEGEGVATISGTTYLGTMGMAFLGATSSQVSTKPTGIIGTLRGVTSDGNKAFTAAFGARPE